MSGRSSGRCCSRCAFNAADAATRAPTPTTATAVGGTGSSSNDFESLFAKELQRRGMESTSSVEEPEAPQASKQGAQAWEGAKSAVLREVLVESFGRPAACLQHVCCSRGSHRRMAACSRVGLNHGGEGPGWIQTKGMKNQIGFKPRR
eukprot:355353-Chlamydomonas_euryale.AAC.5